MKKSRRERTPRAQERLSARDTAERRSPAFYATRRDVGWLVALLTLLDTLVKLALKVIT